MQTNIYFLITSRSFLLRMRNFSDKSCRENQNTHFVLNYVRKMWKNFVEPDRPQTTIWRMRIACWMHKTKIHTQNM